MSQPPTVPPQGDLPQKVIFVGGAPRSGTSVTHALICTAQAVNRYHPEISFVRPVLESYVVGMEKWAPHTSGFFKVPEHFMLHVRKLLQQQMTYVARVLSYPKVLCVKDPLLTPHFAAMQEVLGWPCQFVTVIRHPHSVVRSLQEVVEREGHEFNAELIDFAANDYMNSYAHLNDPTLQDVLFCLRYEDLNEPETLEALRDFTKLPGITPALIWKDDAHIPTSAELADPWYSPKYHQSINLENRLPPLEPVIRDRVNEICAPLMEEYGYNPDGSVA